MRLLPLARPLWLPLAAALCAAPGFAARSPQYMAYAQAQPFRTLTGHIPTLLAAAKPVARVAPSEPVHLALALRIHNEAGLDDLLRRLYTQGDPAQGDFLSTEAFVARFAPSEADYAAVERFTTANGLRADRRHSNRLILDVSGPASAVESAFGTRLLEYRTHDGRIVRGPEHDPVVPEAVASRLQAVVGLDTAAVRKTHFRLNRSAGSPDSGVHVLGADPPGLSPAQIKTAYGLSGTTLTGSGQILALFELDGYRPQDIATYETQFGLARVPLVNVLLDGATGAAGADSLEVTLDIEMMVALAPGVTRIIVYEGQNTNQGVLDTYNRIALDNSAKQVSTSWGMDESSSGSSMVSAENTIFKEMAAQGQAVFAASGDNGANDNGTSLSVDDPGAQPYVTAVGGTALTTNGGAYVSETTWSLSGGGKSLFWQIPAYQIGLVSAASRGSTSVRNVPDVSLNANPASGYAIYHGGWAQYGGTSCGAPLWAAFTALLNQKRAALGNPPIGFMNPALYSIGASAQYAAGFHDIADGTTNGFYPSVNGFDDATGWGSFNGSALLTDLATASGSSGSGGGPTLPAQLISNPGFENGSNPSPWVASTGVINSNPAQPAHSGSWKALLGGFGRVHTSTVMQPVAIPSTISRGTLTFWIHVDTAETSRLANDTITIQVRSASGAVLRTLAIYSNRNAGPGFSQKSFDMLPYKGKTIQIYTAVTENSTRATSVVLDDFALNVE